jgi:uncharacterized protein YdeI (BOF family)
MNARCLYVTVAALVLCLMSTMAGAVQLIYDNFDADTTGTGIVPPGWSIATISSTFASITPDTQSGGKYLALYDANNDANSNCLTHTLGPVTTTSGSGTGEVVVQADFKFQQTSSAFLVIISDGAGTTAANDLVRIVFEGNVAWASDGGAGKISYLQTISPATTYVTFKDTGSPQAPLTYLADKWYTLKIKVYLKTGRYHVFFGPRGGSIVDIDKNTDPADPGLPFASSKSQLDRYCLMSSSKINPETAGTMCVDNVNATGDVQSVQCATIAQAKIQHRGTIVQLAGKIVTAGTDQLAGGNGIFYIQDESGGMRIRPFPLLTVHQGDRVNVSGPVDRMSETGSYVKRVGERELGAGGLCQVDVTPGPFPLPRPTLMTNKDYAGGNFGPIDTDGYVCVPGGYAGDGDGVLQTPTIGLHNIGRYVTVYGTVIYSDVQSPGGGGHPFFYIDDGSGVLDGKHFMVNGVVQKGVRVYCMDDVVPRLNDILGKFAIVTGVIGAIGCNEGWPTWWGKNSTYMYCNVPVVRPTEETFVDTNHNGVWDQAEPYTDSNGNGQYDPGEPFTDTLRCDGIWEPDEQFTDTFNTYNGVWDEGDIWVDDNNNGYWDPTDTWVDLNGDGIFERPEPYVDTNGDGFYELGEPFTDLPQINGVYDLGEPFVDTPKYNGVWDDAEPFVDSNGNGVKDQMIFLTIP